MQTSALLGLLVILTVGQLFISGSSISKTATLERRSILPPPMYNRPVMQNRLPVDPYYDDCIDDVIDDCIEEIPDDCDDGVVPPPPVILEDCIDEPMPAPVLGPGPIPVISHGVNSPSINSASSSPAVATAQTENSHALSMTSTLNSKQTQSAAFSFRIKNSGHIVIALITFLCVM